MTSSERVLRALAVVAGLVATDQLGAELSALELAIAPFLRRGSPQSPPVDEGATSAHPATGAGSGVPDGSGAGFALALTGSTVLASVNPAVKVRRAKTTRAALGRIFAYWRETTGHPRAQLTPERRRAVLGRLSQGYVEADIMVAIDGAAGSDFHADDLTRHDLTLICRNGSKLEGFIERGGGEVDDYTQTENGGSHGRAASLRERIADAMREGDHERYERLNQELRGILS